MSAGSYSRRAFPSALGVTGAAAATAGAVDLFGAAAAFAAIPGRQTGLVLDSGGSVASGSTVKQWTWDGSTNLQWTFAAV
jgi:hypothetical protein